MTLFFVRGGLIHRPRCCVLELEALWISGVTSPPSTPPVPGSRVPRARLKGQRVHGASPSILSDSLPGEHRVPEQRSPRPRDPGWRNVADASARRRRVLHVSISTAVWIGPCAASRHSHACAAGWRHACGGSTKTKNPARHLVLAMSSSLAAPIGQLVSAPCKHLRGEVLGTAFMRKLRVDEPARHARMSVILP